MKLLLFLCVLGVPCVAAVPHSLQYFYTGSSGVPNFPEYVSVGMLDGQPIVYYDSNIRKMIPKQDWMEKNEGPEYWEVETQNSIGAEQVSKGNIEIAKQRFNQTEGLHIVQRMYGCEWDDETGEVDGFNQYGYDGEDFISMDLKNSRYIAAKQQAVITKRKLDNNKGLMEQQKNYLTQECPEWGRKYLKDGSSSLLRTELPTVSLLQRTPSSPVTCHATGFYPDRAELMWKKGDEELQEDVVRGQVLPNHDGTFQMSVDLDLSGVKAEDWGSYSCVFQLAGVEDDVVTVLDKAVVRTNRPGNAGLIAGVVAALILLPAAAAAIGLFIWKRNPGGFQKTNFSEPSSSSSEDSAVKNTPSEEQEMLKSRG